MSTRIKKAVLVIAVIGAAVVLATAAAPRERRNADLYDLDPELREVTDS